MNHTARVIGTKCRIDMRGPQVKEKVAGTAGEGDKEDHDRVKGIQG